MILSKIPNSNYIGDGDFIIVNENLQPVIDEIISFDIFKKGKALEIPNNQTFFAGKSTTYLTENDFDRISIVTKSGDAKDITVQDFNILKEQYDFDQYQLYKLKVKAGIIK